MPTTLEQLQYGFDRDSRRVWRQRATTQGWDNAYVYDSLSQVIGDDRGDLNQARNAIAGIPANGSRWQYDETGNWHGYQTLADGAATLSQSRTHDKGNRLMEVSEAAAMRTDRVGRMLETVPGPAGDWSQGYEITWDAWSRIVWVASVDGETVTPVATYGYDGLTRRIARYTNAEDVTLHSYYNDEWRPVEERREGGSSALQYLWGSRHRDDLVRRDTVPVAGGAAEDTHYVLMDYFSPVAVVDVSGDMIERYQFSAFGLRTILSPSYQERAESEIGFEFSFQGQFEDVETGWLNYGYRYYLPALGRWACKDPVQEKGGFNLYIASHNSLINQVDLLGLAPVPNNTSNAPMNPTPRLGDPPVNPIDVEGDDGTGENVSVTVTGRNLCDCDHDGKIIIEVTAYTGHMKTSQKPGNRVTHNGEYKNRPWMSDKPGYEGLEGHTTIVIRPKCPEGNQSGDENLQIQGGSKPVNITVTWSYACSKVNKKCRETDAFQYKVKKS